MIKLIFALVIITLSACASPTLITPNLDSASAQHSALPADQAFLNELYDRLEMDNAIPKPGKKAAIALHEHEPTFAFNNNQRLILQFNVFELPKDNQEIKEIALRLIEAGSNAAGEHSVPLSGIEVVFYLPSSEPWLAIGSTSPWQAEQLVLAPLHPEYIERLQQMGVIRPTPEPEPSPQNLS